jgi:hypothetical protein
MQALLGEQEGLPGRSFLGDIVLPPDDMSSKPTIEDDPQIIEQYIFDQLQKGDQKAAEGPATFPAAALHYFNALSLYPMFYELYMLFAQKLHPTIFKTLQMLIIQTTNKKRMAYFPKLLASCKRAPIDVIETANHVSSLVAKETMEGSRVLLEEEPLIVFLRPDMDTDVFCNYCFVPLEAPGSIEIDALGSRYCSSACSEQAWNRYQQLVAVLKKGHSATAFDAVMALSKKNSDMHLVWMVFRLILLMTVSELSNPLHMDTYTITEHIERLPVKHYKKAQDIIERGLPALREVFRGPYDKLGESK